MNKEEYIKKTKTKIKRTKVTVESFMTGHDMSSKIKDLDLDIVEFDGREFFDIQVKQIEVCHELHNVKHHFLYRPCGDHVEVKDCQYLDNNYYKHDYLLKLNSYDMWKSHFRETMWCVAKALKNERWIVYDK